MQVRFTKHAEGRMLERGITDDQICHAIEFPDKIGRSIFNHSRFVIKKIYFNLHLAKKHLLMIIYEEKKDEVLVITIIDTSKIDRYF